MDSIDALMIVPPVVAAHLYSSPSVRAEAIKVFLLILYSLLSIDDKYDWHLVG